MKCGDSEVFFTECRSSVAVTPDLYFEYPVSDLMNINGCPDWVIYSTFRSFQIIFRITPKLLKHQLILENMFYFVDRLCGLVVKVPGYRSRDPGFDSRLYKIFWEVVGLKRGPLSLVGTIEELLGRNSNGFGLENREYGRGDPLRWPRDTLYPQKLALTSLTCGGSWPGIVRLFYFVNSFTQIYFSTIIESNEFRTNVLFV
jgi:hypothetical protein